MWGKPTRFSGGRMSQLDMSFYDASYACIARRLGMVLVTEDDKLAKKVRGYIKMIAAAELM